MRLRTHNRHKKKKVDMRTNISHHHHHHHNLLSVIRTCEELIAVLHHPAFNASAKAIVTVGSNHLRVLIILRRVLGLSVVTPIKITFASNGACRSITDRNVSLMLNRTAITTASLSVRAVKRLALTTYTLIVLVEKRTPVLTLVKTVSIVRSLSSTLVSIKCPRPYLRLPALLACRTALRLLFLFNYLRKALYREILKLKSRNSKLSITYLLVG